MLMLYSILFALDNVIPIKLRNIVQVYSECVNHNRTEKYFMVKKWVITT